MKRNYSLDVFRLLLAYVVAFFHFGITLPPTPEVAVVIFFILSGYFLGRKFYARSACDPESYTAWDYTLDHAKSIYPHYLLSMTVFFLYIFTRQALVFLSAPTAEGLWEMGRQIYYQIPDLLFLQSSFCFHPSINYPAWQISALLIGGYFVYALLCANERLTRRIVFPAAILMVQSLLFTGIDLFDNFGPLYMPLLRAFSGLSIGVLTWYCGQLPQMQMFRRHSLAANLASLGCIAALLLFTNKGSIYLVTVPFIILTCQDPDCWINKALNRSCFRLCGKLSMAVYLNHALMERIVKALILPRVHLNQWQGAVLFFVLVTIYSRFTLLLAERATKMLNAKC